MHAISIHNLKKVYKAGTKEEKLAVDGLSLQVPKGQFLGLLGPNGAGKTTTISCITGVSEPTEGSIKVMGHDVVSDYKNARKQIGISPQEFNIDFFMTVEDVLYYQAGFFGIVGEARKKRMEEMLNLFELQEHRKKKFNFLSGGLKRRTIVAKALIHNPSVIILDEPTAGVDVETRRSIWEYLKKLHKDESKTIILTSHYLEEIEEMCERVVIIKGGKLMYDEDIKVAMQDGKLEKKYLEITQAN